MSNNSIGSTIIDWEKHNVNFSNFSGRFPEFYFPHKSSSSLHLLENLFPKKTIADVSRMPQAFFPFYFRHSLIGGRGLPHNGIPHFLLTWKPAGFLAALALKPLLTATIQNSSDIWKKTHSSRSGKDSF